MRAVACLLLTFTGLLGLPQAAFAGQEVGGEGWRLFLPDGFQVAPPSAAGVVAVQVRKLVAATGIPLSSSPSQRQFVFLGPRCEEGRIVVLRYGLVSGRAPRSVGELDIDAIEDALELAARDQPGLEVRRVDRAALSKLADGIRVTVVETSPTGAVSEFRFAIVVGAGSAVVVVLDAEYGSCFDVQETWQRLLASLRITDPSPGPEVWFPTVGLVLGLLLVLFVGFTVLRRRKVEPSYVMSIDPTAMPLADGDAMPTGSRPVDGLLLVDDAGTASSPPPPPPPPKAPPRAAPAHDEATGKRQVDYTGAGGLPPERR